MSVAANGFIYMHCIYLSVFELYACINSFVSVSLKIADIRQKL